MDILHLIDRLEEEISQGYRLPFSSTVIVNEERLWDIIDTMRISVPEEVQQAQQVERERERILAQAQEEAGRIVALARRQAEEMKSDREVIQSAKAEAEDILTQAQREAQQFQAEADSYALEVLTKLEEQLSQTLQAVQNGVEQLSNQREKWATPKDES
ncbi:MAG: ATPase [Chloroflexota bacterium]|nr:ATPase [Chloroflexota bacterium]